MNQLLNNRYQILSTLGRGGFGETFLAEDTYMPSRRRCVIKQLKPLVNSPEVEELIRERFQREAAILEALGEGHSQIPTLYAYFIEAGQYYLVQEWVEGPTLARYVQQHGFLSERAARELLLDLLPVLESIHHRGIIHRDIKPDNIILRSRDGKPVLIDFGAVRETMGTQIESQSHATRSIVVGTPGFMPSEQAAGRPIFSSDLYSLALTLLYLLTGQSPQQLSTDLDTGEILLPALAVTPSLRAVLERASRSHPRDRFSSARAMLEALQAPETQGNLQVATLPPPEAPTVLLSAPKAEIPLTVPLSAPKAEIPPTVPLSAPKTEAPPATPATPGKPRVPIALAMAGGLTGAAIASSFFLSQLAPPQRSRSVEFNYTSSPPSPTVSKDNYAWLSQRQVVDADLAGKTAFELDIMRNSLFARHGRRFDSAELQAYFNNQAWYQPRYAPQEFPDSALSSLEIKNASHILNYQNRNNLRWIQDSISTKSNIPPKQVLYNYYATINDGNYEKAWNHLTPRFQNDRSFHSQGYQSYSTWWNSVDRVEIEDVKLLEEGVEIVRLEMRAKYYLKSGNVISTFLRFKLVWDAASSRWLIDDAQQLKQ